MTTQAAGRLLRLERSLGAPPETVYRAISEPAHLARGYAPSDEFEVHVHEWDLRPGGRYRISMKHKGGDVHTPVGEFREVVPGRRLSYTWTWEGQPPMDTLVSFELRAERNGTRLTLTHSGFPADEARDKHQEGWTGCLERLARLLST